MSSFIVHMTPGSPFGRAVLIALEEKRERWRLAPVAPSAFKTEPHLQRHPFGRVPVLEHGGFLLYETQAILRYLDRVLPNPALTPADAKAAARMDQVMNINDWYLFQGVNTVIGFNRVVKPRLLGLPPDEAAIAAAMPKARTVFNELARLLGSATLFRRREPVACRRAGCPADRFLPRPTGMGALDGSPSQPRHVARPHDRPGEPQGNDVGARARSGAGRVSRLPFWPGLSQAKPRLPLGMRCAGRRHRARESHFPLAPIPDMLPLSRARSTVLGRVRTHEVDVTGTA